MRAWDNLRQIYLTKKAQSLTELATFGSVLLLAVSFLISYAMRYNYQQEAKMASFRMAMADAFNSTSPDASATVFLLEDRHIPNPQDTFGVGSFSPKQGVGEVTWGDNLGGSYSSESELPKLKFNINGNSIEYGIQGFKDIVPNERIFRIIPPGTYDELFWSSLRVYQSIDTVPSYKAMFLIENNPSYNEDNEVEVLETLYLVQAGESFPMFIPYKIVGVEPKTHGAQVTKLTLAASEEAELNPNYMAMGRATGKYVHTYPSGDFAPEVVTIDTVQGLLPITDQTNKRYGIIALQETPSKWESTSMYDLNGTEITHYIRRNGNVIDTYTTPIPGGKLQTWQTPK